MLLKCRNKITWIIYTEPYSNRGISRDELLETAQTIRGVIGVFPYHINDELEVTLSSYCDIDYFLYEFERRLIDILNKKKQ